MFRYLDICFSVWCVQEHTIIYNICVFRFASGCALRLDLNKGTAKNKLLDLVVCVGVSLIRCNSWGGKKYLSFAVVVVALSGRGMCAACYIIASSRRFVLRLVVSVCVSWIIAKVRFYLVVVCFVSRVWSFIHIHILYILYCGVVCVVVVSLCVLALMKQPERKIKTGAASRTRTNRKQINKWKKKRYIKKSQSTKNQEEKTTLGKCT